MRLIIVIASILLTCSVSAQSYMPMLGETNSWSGVSCFFGCTVENYYTAGDTIVDGNNYKVLDGYHYIQRNFLIREDVSEKKVFMKLLGGHQLLNEYPLFDFSLEVGDTTNAYNPISPLPLDGGLFVLDSIVSRPLENGNHRFFYLHAVAPSLSASERTVWVEGVGALSLINTPGANRTESNHLGCALKDGVLQYAFTDSIGNCSNVSVDESISFRPEFFRLIPNLISRNEGVQIISETVDFEVSMRIYSTDGRLILQKEHITNGRHYIDGSQLPTGLLLVVLFDQEGNSFRLPIVKTTI